MVSLEGEVLLPTPDPYVALDARSLAREHLPVRNVVATLFELTRANALADTSLPLAGLGAWLPALGPASGAVEEAYAEWLATTAPQHFGRESALELVGRFARTGDAEGNEEEGMAYTAFEENLQRKLRRTRREGVEEGIELGLEQGIERGMEQGMEQGIERGMEQGIAQGMEQGIEHGMEQGIEQGMEQGMKQGLTAMRDMLLTQVQSKFGESAARRVAGPLAGVEDLGALQRAGRWIVDSATADELAERLGNGRAG